MIEDIDEYIRYQIRKLKGKTYTEKVYTLNAIYAVLEEKMEKNEIKNLIDKILKENIRDLTDKLKNVFNDKLDK